MTMEDVQIRLSGLWVALMLTYLLGDVLRIFSGDFKEGEIGGLKVTQAMWLGIAILMVIPIVMVFLSLTLKNPANRWANIIVAIVFFAFNLIGLPTYPSAYDKFLIVVGLGFNVATVWYAWRWVWDPTPPLARVSHRQRRCRALHRVSTGWIPRSPGLRLGPVPAGLVLVVELVVAGPATTSPPQPRPHRLDPVQHARPPLSQLSSMPEPTTREAPKRDTPVGGCAPRPVGGSRPIRWFRLRPVGLESVCAHGAAHPGSAVGGRTALPR